MSLTLAFQDWSSGARCRAVYSEDGLVYPAVVLWVKGQRCRVRFDNYNNEEEQDVGGLLQPDELLGARRTPTAKVRRTSTCSSWMFVFGRLESETTSYPAGHQLEDL